MWNCFYFCIFLYLISTTYLDDRRKDKIKKQLKKCVSKVTPICQEYEDLLALLMEMFGLNNNLVESSSEFFELLENKGAVFYSEANKNDVYQRSKLFLKMQNNYIHYSNIVKYIDKMKSNIDPYLSLLINKFVISHEIQAADVKRDRDFYDIITNPQIYVRRDYLKLVYDKYVNINRKRVQLLVDLLSDLNDVEKRSEKVINLLEYLQIFDDENLNEIQNYRNSMKYRIDISLATNIDSVYEYVLKTFESQKVAKEKILKYIETYENINYFKASLYSEEFIDAYGLEKRQINQDLIKCIFNKKIAGDKEKKLKTIEDIVKYYIDFKARQIIKDKVLQYIGKLDNGAQLSYNSPLADFIHAYEIDLEIKTYEDLYDKIYSKDLVVNQAEISIIYPWLVKYTKDYLGLFLMLKIESYMKKDTETELIHIYEYISLIMNFYDILNDKEITYENFIGKIIEKDKVVNRKFTKMLFEYVKMYFTYKERNNIKKKLINAFNQNHDLFCLSQFYNLLKFIEEYKITNKEAKNYDNFKTRIELIDGYSNFYHIQSIYKILTQCYDFTMRRKYRDDFSDYYRKDSSSKIYKYSTYMENIVKSYDLKLYDVSSRKNLESKIENMDKYSDFLEVTNLYKMLDQYMKYRYRRNAIKSLAKYLTKQSLSFSKVRQEIEIIISGYDIKTKTLHDVKNLNYLIMDADGIVIPNEVQVIQPYLEKWVKILIRKVNLDNLKIKLSTKPAETNFYLMNELYYLTNEYDLHKNPVNSIAEFIERIKVYDEIVYFNDIISLYEATKNFIDLYKRNEVLDDTNQYLIDNKNVNFIQMSPKMDIFISVYDIKDEDIKTMDVFRTYIKNKQGIFFEYQIGVIYSTLKQYFDYKKRNQLTSRLTKAVISTKPRGHFQLVTESYEFLILYGISHSHINEYYEFLKKIQEIDGYTNQYQLKIIYDEVVKHYKNFENIKNLNKLASIVDKKSSDMVLEDYAEFDNIISSYELENINIKHFKDFEKRIIDSDVISIEKYLAKIHPRVFKYLERLRFEEKESAYV